MSLWNGGHERTSRWIRSQKSFWRTALPCIHRESTNLSNCLREMGFRDPWRETVINHPRWPLCHAHTLLACRGGEMTYQILQILPFELLQKVRNGLARVILKMSAPCWGCVETMPISTRILQQMRPNVNIIK